MLSAVAPTQLVLHGALAGWMDRNSGDLFLLLITVAEIEDAIAKAGRLGAHRKAERLAAWLETVVHLYSPRILPMDLAIARALGRISDLARQAGRAPGLADLAIAATARVHAGTVLSRHVPDFAGLGVPVCNPYEALPAQ